MPVGRPIWSRKKMNTLDRKTIVITGSNAGIGLAIARQVALRKQRIILACRNAAKAEAACQELVSAAPGAEILIRALDLSSFASIREFASSLEKEFPAVDVLVNNAGLMPWNEEYTQDGFEMQFGVNYLGHFMLTHLLLPVLANAPRPRIVHVSSIGHYIGRINYQTFRGGRKLYLLGLPAYAQSKLANVLFSNELSQRLPAHFTSNAVHPGFVDSDFFRHIPAFIYKPLRMVMVSPEQCGRFIADMALSDAWAGRSGEFVSAQGPLPISRKTRNEGLRRQLYAESCRLAGVAPITDRNFACAI
jgi:NAD(P)-dependent dehydrogenase (short-subunit alcohol dehydrogenase family)